MEKPAKNGITYQFGEFRLDSAQRLIFRAGRPVPLAPKVIETLLALVERGGTLVTKLRSRTRDIGGPSTAPMMPCSAQDDRLIY